MAHLAQCRALIPVAPQDHTVAPDPLPGTLAVPVLQHSALSSHRLGLDGMKMQVKCCRSSAVTERDPDVLGQPMG